MMNKTIARGLLPLVNNPYNFEPLLDYVNSRIVFLHGVMEQHTDIHAIFRLQGQIIELRRILGLRDEANTDSK